VAPAEGDFFAKHGAYAEIEQPITEALDLLGRADALYRAGNIADPTPLTSSSYVIRETLAAAYAIERNFRFKGSVEVWQFSYGDQAGRDGDISFHLGAVGSF
jgi:hypothetical protein